MKFGRAIQNGMEFVRGNFGTDKVRELNHRLGDAIGKFLGGSSGGGHFTNYGFRFPPLHGRSGDSPKSEFLKSLSVCPTWLERSHSEAQAKEVPSPSFRRSRSQEKMILAAVCL